MDMRNSPQDKLLAALESYGATVGIIGLGYVGLPLAVTAAARGFPVVGFDVDATKIAHLDRGESYIEAVTQGALAEVIDAGRVSWTDDFTRLAECKVIVICVPTPLTRYREPDLSYVEATARTIAENMVSGTLVVLESTTFPGTTDEVLTPILASQGLEPNQDFWVAFSPEREDPGNKTYRTHSIPKIVGGDSEMAGRLAVAFYTNVVDKVVPVSSTRTAEAVKITENIFRSVNIALVNELKMIYDAMGIDVWEVIDGAATKPFTFVQAAAFQWINPKAWIMCISISAQFLDSASPLKSAAIIAGVSMIGGVTSATGWAWFGMLLARWLHTSARLRAFNWSMAAIILAGVLVVIFGGV